MPLNSDLVKPELDGEEYSNACPTIGTLALAGFSLPSHPDTAMFAADGLFFATHPSRRVYLRPALRGEFDIYTCERDFEERPTLWVMVTLLAPAHHLRLPIWRGKAFWSGKECDSDDKVAQVVFMTCVRGGVHLSEWQGFISDRRIDKANKSKKRTKNPMVN